MHLLTRSATHFDEAIFWSAAESKLFKLSDHKIRHARGGVIRVLKAFLQSAEMLFYKAQDHSTLGLSRSVASG